MSFHPTPRDTHLIRTRDPLELSARVIDSEEADEPTIRVSNELCEVDDGVAVVESFSNMVIFDTDDGLVCVDSSGPLSGADVVKALRTWTPDAVNSLVYTHGHLDHVAGSGPLAADADRRGHRRPEVVAHQNLPPRFERYQATSTFNQVINLRQFAGMPTNTSLQVAGASPGYLSDDILWPTRTYTDEMPLEVGGLEMRLHHDKGETDDHTWMWVPQHRALCVGDLFAWVFPNAGNPQKVQRYPREWAAALRTMATLNAELLLPAHGLPVRGAKRVRKILTTLAEALESLVTQTIDMMNAGATLDEVLHEVRLPTEWTSRPWMRPTYDEPEFVVRNIWRLYGGWWDLDPAELKPAPRSALAAEVVALGGGSAAFAARASEVADAGDLPLACHLIELAVRADPESRQAHAVRAEIYAARRMAESSLMSKSIYRAAAAESEAITRPESPA